MRYIGICSIAFHPGSLNVKQKLLSCGHLTLVQNSPVLTAELVGIAGSWPLSRKITVLYVCLCVPTSVCARKFGSGQDEDGNMCWLTDTLARTNWEQMKKEARNRSWG